MCWTASIAYSQVNKDIVAANIKIIQLAKADKYYGCPNPRSSDTIQNSSRRYDKKIVRFLNRFYNDLHFHSKISKSVKKVFLEGF